MYDYNPNEKAKKEIKRAVQFQKMVLEKLRSEGGPVELERFALADFFYEIAKYSNDYEKNVDTSIAMLNECIKIHN